MKNKQNTRAYSMLGIIKRVFSYIKKHRMLIILYLVLSIGITFINLIFANLINTSIESAVNFRQDELFKYIVQAGIAVVAGVVFTYLSVYIYGVFKAKIMLDIRSNAIEHLQKLQLSFVENNHTGDIISRFTRDMNTVQNFIGQDMFQIIIQLISMIITSVYLINVNYKLYIASLILMPPVLFLSTKVTKPMGYFFKEGSANLAKANAVAQDSYGGLFIIKAFNLEEHFEGRFSAYVKNSLQYSIKGIHRLKWLPPFNIILWSSPFTICLIYGAYLSINNELSLGQLPAFIYLFNSIIWPFAALPRTFSNIQNSIGTANRFFEVLDKPVEREGGKDFDISEADNCINFKNITFSYNNDSLDFHKEECDRKTILENLSFEVRKGSKLALVGKSGCGKSTILKLILGLYDYSEGKIDFFGHDLSEWSIQAIRSKISFVSQDTYLFPTSIFDNILYGRTEATAQEVVSAAKAAGAHEFIMELPDGYDTMVGERGIKLSGGQKQRISLARAFLKDAPLIVLDEPTSALDNISEAMVLDEMNAVMQNKTAIIVTHKLSAIKNVDEILVIENGHIVESGTPDALMSTDSNYSRLYSKQFVNEN